MAFKRTVKILCASSLPFPLRHRWWTVEKFVNRANWRIRLCSIFDRDGHYPPTLLGDDDGRGGGGSSGADAGVWREEVAGENSSLFDSDNFTRHGPAPPTRSSRSSVLLFWMTKRHNPLATDLLLLRYITRRVNV